MIPYSTNKNTTSQALGVFFKCLSIFIYICLGGGFADYQFRHLLGGLLLNGARHSPSIVGVLLVRGGRAGPRGEGMEKGGMFVDMENHRALIAQH